MPNWVGKLWPVAAVLWILALVFGGREKNNERADQLQDELAEQLREAARLKRRDAAYEAMRRRGLIRNLSPSDRTEGILRRARERARKDAQ